MRRVRLGASLRHRRTDLVDNDLLPRANLALQPSRGNLLLPRHQRVPALLLDLVGHGVADRVRRGTCDRLVFEAAETIDRGFFQPVEQIRKIGIGFAGEADDEGRAQRQVGTFRAPLLDPRQRLFLRGGTLHGFQDVRAGDARITGSLDMIDIAKQDKTMTVTDYKTGHPSVSWDKGDDHTKLKLHKYRQQLVFYKILVENSAEYHNFDVTHGQLAFIEPTRGGESVLLSLDLSAQDIERTTKLIQAVWKHIITLDLPDTSSYTPDITGVLAFEQDLIDGLV